MSLTRPSELPVFSIVSGVTDPVSGQQNVITPPAAYQASGYPYNVYPARQDFNYLGFHVSNWLEYIDNHYTPIVNAGGYQSGEITDATISDDYFETEKIFTLKWARVANMIAIAFPDDIYGNKNGVTYEKELRITFPTGLPAGIVR